MGCTPYQQGGSPTQALSNPIPFPLHMLYFFFFFSIPSDLNHLTLAQQLWRRNVFPFLVEPQSNQHSTLKNPAQAEISDETLNIVAFSSR